jgi:hypothetical protein
MNKINKEKGLPRKQKILEEESTISEIFTSRVRQWIEGRGGSTKKSENGLQGFWDTTDNRAAQRTRAVFKQPSFSPKI